MTSERTAEVIRGLQVAVTELATGDAETITRWVSVSPAWLESKLEAIEGLTDELGAAIRTAIDVAAPAHLAAEAARLRSELAEVERRSAQRDERRRVERPRRWSRSPQRDEATRARETALREAYRSVDRVKGLAAE